MYKGRFIFKTAVLSIDNFWIHLYLFCYM